MVERRQRGVFLAFLAVSLGATLSTKGLAQAGDPSEAASDVTLADSIYVPRASTNEARTFHVHEGFYFRLGFGLGGATASFSDVKDTARYAGGAGGIITGDLLFGGTPGAGLVVGGGVLGSTLFSGIDENGWLVGPFLDIFPNPQGGWHLGVMPGVSVLSAHDIVEDENFAVVGGGIGFWAGYDAWVSPDWAVGGMLQAIIAQGSGEHDIGLGLEDDVTVRTVGLSLSVSVLYN